MHKELFKRKIRELDDNRLLDLLRLRYEPNREVIELAIEEAKKRGLDLPEIQSTVTNTPLEKEDMDKLEKWNWGAFLLAPFWTLANKLERWTLLTFIPGINILVIIYLAIKGNRLAYAKSRIRNIDQFIALQSQWSIWGIRIFLVFIFASILAILISVGNK